MNELAINNQTSSSIKQLFNSNTEQYDSILLNKIVGVIDPADILDIFSQSIQQIKNSGYFKVVFTNIKKIVNAYKENNISYEDTTTLIYSTENKPYNSSDIINLLESAGFQGIREFDSDNYDTLIVARKPINDTESIKFTRELNRTRIIIYSDFTNYTSQGIIASQLLRYLNNRAYNVYGLQDEESNNDSYEEDIKHLISYNNKPLNNNDLIIHIGHISSASRRKFNTNNLWGYFFHEYTTLPSEWLFKLSNYSKLFFVSSFCSRVVLQSGFRGNTEVIHHGVDTSIFMPGEKTEWKDEFVFLSVAKQQKRKGTAELISAFHGAFTPNEKVRLVIKDLEDNTSVNYDDYIETDQVTVIKENYNDGEIAHLMQQADCFVLPSYIEGFGMSILEAKASKLPVITTNFGGQADFCKESDTYFVEYDIIPRTEGTPPEVISRWAVPKTSSLAYLMTRVRNIDEERTNKSQLGYEVAKQMTWDSVLSQFIESIKEVYH